MDSLGKNKLICAVRFPKYWLVRFVWGQIDDWTRISLTLKKMSLRIFPIDFEPFKIS